MNRYALRDDQWERIKDLLPGKPGDVGVTAHDNRRFVEAVLYRYRTGIPWRDLPERRSKGGLSTKIHALVDALGNPLRFLVTPGQAHDLTGADALLPQNGRRGLDRRQSLRCRRSRPQAAGECRKIRRHPLGKTEQRPASSMRCSTRHAT